MSNIALLNQDLPDFLQTAGVSDLTKQLAGRTGTKRIVPKNGIFRKVVGGEEMGKVKGTMDVIVVSASPKVGRIFYAKQWTPDAEPTAPDCFSNDGNAPDAGSANKQSDRCDSCSQNISLDYVVTQMSFNEDNDNQSILFTPVRFIDKAQYEVTSKVAAKPEVQKMVTMTPYQADVSGRAPKLAASAPTPAPQAAAEEVDEPKKRESKKAETPAPTAKKNLDSVVAAWTDEE